MSNPIVSVIIPIYNTEKYLGECLDSVLNQSLTEIEVICINDGSTDGSLDIINSYANVDKRIKVINQDNHGQSYARNRGLEIATGEYIYFMDSDDLLAEGALGYLWNESKENNLDVLYFDADAIYEDEELKNRLAHYETYYKRPRTYNKVYTGEELFTLFIRDDNYRVQPCLQFTKRSVITTNNIMFLEGIIQEDNLFATQVILAGNRVSHRSETLFVRRVRNTSTMTVKKNFRHLYGFLKCIIELEKLTISNAKYKTAVSPITKQIEDLQNDLKYVYSKMNNDEIEKISFIDKSEERILNSILNDTYKLFQKGRNCDNVERLISVIVPVYNVEEYVSQCILSICRQTYKNVEIICVDDGSTDTSGEICEYYGRIDSRIKVIHQENGGLSAARNTGIEVAEGEYLCFVDSDDWVHPDYLKTLYTMCVQGDYDISECGIDKLQDGTIPSIAKEAEVSIVPGSYLVHKRFDANGWKHGVVWNKLYKKELFKELRFPVGKQHEDDYTEYKILYGCKNIAVTEAPLYYYRQRTSSIMGCGFNLKSLDIIQAYEEKVEFFKGKDEELFKKSLLSLHCTLWRLKKNVEKVFPMEQDIISDIKNKISKVVSQLKEANIEYKDIPDEYIIIPASEVALSDTYSLELCTFYENAGLFDDTCISVIVPCFNSAETLVECLNSITIQSIKNIEIILVNDGSTDDTESIMNHYASLDERVVVINQMNLGVYTARNRAMRIAKGEFVCFMDSDDFYPNEEVLKLLYDKAKNNKAFICGGSFSYYRDGNVETEFSGSNAKYTFDSEGFVEYSDYQFDYGYHRFLYNTTFLKENDIYFPPYRRCQDPPFFVKAMVTAGRFYAIPDVVYRYRVGVQIRPNKWPASKLVDMFKGYVDLLTYAKDYKLAELHNTVVERINGDYSFGAVMDSIVGYNYELLDAIVKANSLINIEYLQQAGICDLVDSYYLVKPLKNLIWRSNNGQLAPETREKEELKAEIDMLRGCMAYKVGRMITWPWRKIKSLLGMEKMS